MYCISRALSSRCVILPTPKHFTRRFMMTGENKARAGGPLKKSRKAKKDVKEGSTEEVLLAELQRLLSEQKSVAKASKDDQEPQELSSNSQPLPERFSEVQVSITSLSSTGDGLGFSEDGFHVYVVPFTVPGDVATAKVIAQHVDNSYTVTDFVSITTPSSLRDDTRIICQYFGRCSGCQLQMLSYPEQLAHKRTVIERAYKHFANLAPERIPTVGETMSSPLEYGYRTKLTPHFDGPPGSNSRRWGKKGRERPKFTEVPPIGFNFKNQRKVLDVEDCPISTDAVRRGLKEERKRVERELDKYQRGATILVRETTSRAKGAPDSETTGEEKAANGDASYEHRSASSKCVETKGYTTDNNGIAAEYVDDFVFHNVAGAFFQNNNSILPKVTQYIRDHILRPAASSSSSSGDSARPAVTNLLDAYCGSGLFTITLSSLFQRSIGIDIADASIRCARKNAELNGIKGTSFIVATASKIFADLDVKPDTTAVVIDPPRKGCDQDFLNQLLEFGPQRIVYVSCNVHTQARDVGALVEGRDTSAGKRCRYDIESIRGFDFFPQTGHVEAVAVLDRTEPS
jgi:tRNA (uracil-5-)-methyltransferase